MKKPNFTLLALIPLVALITLFIRIPLPSKGYFNFGDVAVVFAGLILGYKQTNKVFIWAFIAGGLGSAIADIIGGFAIFAPFTLMAKGLEAGLASISLKKKTIFHYTLLIIGGICMVATYFIAEVLMPSFGLQLAVQEIIPNLIQATGGIIGGKLTFEAYKRISGGE